MNEPRFPSPQNHEAHQEGIHTEEEVLSLILPHINGISGIEELRGKIEKRLIDEQGLTFLRIASKDSATGDPIEYCYVRKGKHGNKNDAEESRIDMIEYSEGIPCASTQLAKFDTASGGWK